MDQSSFTPEILLIEADWPCPLGLMMQLCQQSSMRYNLLEDHGEDNTSALEQGAVSFIIKLPEIISAPIAT